MGEMMNAEVLSQLLLVIDQSSPLPFTLKIDSKAFNLLFFG